MTLLATFKHISSKNADYGAAEAYLTFEHDEFTMKPTLDENGRLIPREDYRISSLNCGGEDFAVACMRANLRYEKNQKREDVKSHHYIISFDPRDAQDKEDNFSVTDWIILSIILNHSFQYQKLYPMLRNAFFAMCSLCFTYISMERGPSKFILKALFFLIRGLTYLTFS